MGAHELAIKARKHWAQWLPKWTDYPLSCGL